jgi:hypothetical protein
MVVIGFSLIVVNTGLLASLAEVFFLAADALRAIMTASASVSDFFIKMYWY